MIWPHCQSMPEGQQRAKRHFSTHTLIIQRHTWGSTSTPEECLTLTLELDYEEQHTDWEQVSVSLSSKVNLIFTQMTPVITIHQNHSTGSQNSEKQKTASCQCIVTHTSNVKLQMTRHSSAKVCNRWTKKVTWNAQIYPRQEFAKKFFTHKTSCLQVHVLSHCKKWERTHSLFWHW